MVHTKIMVSTCYQKKICSWTLRTDIWVGVTVGNSNMKENQMHWIIHAEHLPVHHHLGMGGGGWGGGIYYFETIGTEVCKWTLINTHPQEQEVYRWWLTSRVLLQSYGCNHSKQNVREFDNPAIDSLQVQIYFPTTKHHRKICILQKSFCYTERLVSNSLKRQVYCVNQQIITPQ